MNELLRQLEQVFGDVFGRDVPLSEGMSAKDIGDWDSLQHINLIVAIERRFRVRFATAEISQLKDPGRTIGSLLDLLRQKTESAGRR